MQLSRAAVPCLASLDPSLIGLAERGECVRIEVDDDGGAWTQPSVDAYRPHRLDIIHSLAADWRVRNAGYHRTVWASLDWHRSTRS